MAGAADALRSRLAQYAYAAATPSPKRRRNAPPTAATSGYASDDEDSAPVTPRTPTPSKSHASVPEAEAGAGARTAVPPSPKRETKRRADGSLDKFGWKKPRGYAAPEVYAHLRPVEDRLEPNLKLVFCGINPGKRSSTRGHHFAHPTNKFWRALHLGDLTPRVLSPQESTTLPRLYRYGLTNLVDRATAEQSELSNAEMRAAVLPLVRKFARFRPRVVCFVGKKIWDVFEGVGGAEIRKREKAEKAALKRAGKGPTGKQLERDAVRRDVARQEAKAAREGQGASPNQVVAFALVDGGVVKLESGSEPEVVVKLEPGSEPEVVVKEERMEDGETDEPLVSIETIEDAPLPPTAPMKPHVFRAVPHSSFAYDVPQRLRLVLPDLDDEDEAEAGVSSSMLESGAAEEVDELDETDQLESDGPPSPTPVRKVSPRAPSPPSSPLSSAPASPPVPPVLRVIPPSPASASAAALPAPDSASGDNPTTAPLADTGAGPIPTPIDTHTHTYFWVVPNTSGLERTTLDRHAEIFGRLREFVESFEAGEPEGDFVDMTLADVEVADASLAKARAQTEAKPKAQSKAPRASLRRR